jgi:hypothetical protein
MNRLGNHSVFVLAVLAALAMLALPASAAAKRKDRNHDRIPDRWEKHHHLSLKVKQTWRDQDRDHLRNRQEFLAGTDPRVADSDDDGTGDGQENAGRIESFDEETGRLVIDLFGNDTVSGLVTGQTEIECEGEHMATVSQSGGDDSGDPDEHGDDSSGPGSPNSGPARDDDENDDAERGNCTTADLVEGAIVKEAELKLADETATFEEVALAG